MNATEISTLYHVNPVVSELNHVRGFDPLHYVRVDKGGLTLDLPYDTDDFAMYRRGITLRIREKNVRYIATVKTRDSLHPEQSTEQSTAVENPRDCSFFMEPNLKLYGSLVTDRIVIQKDDITKITLDHNDYLGVEDFELEIEYEPSQLSHVCSVVSQICELLEKHILDFCSETFFHRIDCAKSKSSRFFERYMEIYGRNHFLV